MKYPDHTWLADMLVAARLAQQFVSGVSREELDADVMRESAVIRQLEIVGEAATRVSPDFRAAHPEIPWREIIGMRNVLIHAYQKVQSEEVWNAATISVPELIAVIEPLVAAAEKREEDRTQ